MTRRIVIFGAVLGFVLMTSIPSQENMKEKKKAKPASTRGRSKTVSFKNDVFPVIKKYCLPCHSEEQMNPSELYMDSYESFIEGGKHGKPIEPGKAKESLIIQKLSENPPFGDRMPFKAKQPLSDEEVKILIDWINQGAKKN